MVKYPPELDPEIAHIPRAARIPRDFKPSPEQASAGGVPVYNSVVAAREAGLPEPPVYEVPEGVRARRRGVEPGALGSLDEW